MFLPPLSLFSLPCLGDAFQDQLITSPCASSGPHQLILGTTAAWPLVPRHQKSQIKLPRVAGERRESTRLLCFRGSLVYGRGQEGRDDAGHCCAHQVPSYCCLRPGAGTAAVQEGLTLVAEVPKMMLQRWLPGASSCWTCPALLPDGPCALWLQALPQQGWSRPDGQLVRQPCAQLLAHQPGGPQGARQEPPDW